MTEFLTEIRELAIVAILPDALVLALLLSAAIRCRVVFTAAAINIVALTAVAMMCYNVGRLGDPNFALRDRAIAAQVGLLATTLLALALAAAFSERRQRRRSDARLRSILEATNVVAWEVDIADDTIDAIGPAARLLHAGQGLQPLTTMTLSEYIHPVDRERVLAEFAAALKGTAPFRTEFRIPLPDGGVRWIDSEGSVVRDRKGLPLRMVGIDHDITERKESEEHVKLLMREINHRAKNLMSVVQVMARRSASEDDPAAFAERFNDRIAGLAASHDLLVESDWKGVADLVRTQLAHFRDLIGTRITLEGPALKLKPASAQNIGMALRELATNAAKYGALSGTEGTIHISWGLVATVQNRRFNIRWSERGGPTPKPPSVSGFGRTVMVDMVKHALDADVRLDYPHTGAVWELVAPVEWTIADEPKLESLSGSKQQSA